MALKAQEAEAQEEHAVQDAAQALRRSRNGGEAPWEQKQTEAERATEPAPKRKPKPPVESGGTSGGTTSGGTTGAGEPEAS